MLPGSGCGMEGGATVSSARRRGDRRGVFTGLFGDFLAEFANLRKAGFFTRSAVALNCHRSRQFSGTLVKVSLNRPWSF